MYPWGRQYFVVVSATLFYFLATAGWLLGEGGNSSKRNIVFNWSSQKLRAHDVSFSVGLQLSLTQICQFAQQAGMKIVIRLRGSPTNFAWVKLPTRLETVRKCSIHNTANNFPSSLVMLAIYCTVWSQDSAVGMATCYDLDGRGIGIRVPAEAKIFPPSRRSYWFWGLPSFLSNGYRGLFPQGLSGRRVKLSARLHILPRLRMNELYIHSSTSLYGVVLN
jgi:hypothetical protein